MAEAIAFVRRVLIAAWRTVAADATAFAVMVAVYVGLSLVTDLLLPDAVAAVVNVVLGLLVSYLQLLLTFRVLYVRGMAPPGYTLAARTEARLPSVIALGILAGLLIMLGLVLLVVPGLILAMLWSVAMPALAAERLGASEAMSRSWSLVRPSLGRVALLGTLTTCVVVLSVAPLIAAAEFEGAAVTAALVVGELASGVALIFNAAVWTAAYLDLRGTPAAAT